jgi:uncharacterized membrane protein YdbT with pleckstrin-like domain
LRVYEYVNSLLILLFTIIGIPLIPVWLVLGWVWSGRYFSSLRCELDDRHLRIRRGVLFRRTKTIPLDRIQDLTLLDGPILRAFGLCTLRIETAGQSSPQGSADANLTGLVDAETFQEAVLARRDRLVQQMAGAAHASAGTDTVHAHTPGTPEAPRALPAAEQTLVEIRDLLRSIDSQLRVAR